MEPRPRPGFRASLPLPLPLPAASPLQLPCSPTPTRSPWAFVSGRHGGWSACPLHAGLPQPLELFPPSSLVSSFPWAASRKVSVALRLFLSFPASLSCSLSLLPLSLSCLAVHPPSPLFSPHPSFLPVGNGNPPAVRARPQPPSPPDFPLRLAGSSRPQDRGMVKGPWGLGVPGARVSKVGF